MQEQIDDLQERMEKIEILNQKYLKRNYDLMQENRELSKSKDNQKILERLFWYLMNSINEGTMIGNG